MCRRKHTGRRDIGASQREGDRPALRAAAPTQRGLSSLQPSARTSRREGVPGRGAPASLAGAGRFSIPVYRSAEAKGSWLTTHKQKATELGETEVCWESDETLLQADAPAGCGCCYIEALGTKKRLVS